MCIGAMRAIATYGHSIRKGTHDLTRRLAVRSAVQCELLRRVLSLGVCVVSTHPTVPVS
jgi:hypothetical protein